MRGLIVMMMVLASMATFGQKTLVTGRVVSEDGVMPYTNVLVVETTSGTTTDDRGAFELQLPAGTYHLQFSFIGYETLERSVEVGAAPVRMVVEMRASAAHALNEVVVTGTMREMERLESPVPVEVYTPKFLEKNPTPNVFEAMQQVNGVRPQLNCNVCNTGDIHVNGLEGPYTMILIDGMPIVSGLATVYGLSGIPTSMIQRIEVVKGPASTLYGSEAVGGLINVITKKPDCAPRLSVDAMGTSWQEWNLDAGLRWKAGRRLTMMSGFNGFWYDRSIDHNGDGFTDIANQKRWSALQKFDVERPHGREMSLAMRYVFEDRWGGQRLWVPALRGGDSLYAESIYTNRWEVIGRYQLPLKERVMLSVSLNEHRQDSYYGVLPFMANQRIAFAQLIWEKNLGRHGLLGGAAYRYTRYDDNTVATQDSSASGWYNQVSHTHLPGVFLEDNMRWNDHHSSVFGLRYDYNTRHGGIVTPRFAHKWQWKERNTLRLNLGTGYRVVNLFTEEHAALTGAREVIIVEQLKPERSYNVNLNYVRTFDAARWGSFVLDGSLWYTYFTNRIVPNYDVDPDAIIYQNLNGYSVSRGASVNIDYASNSGLSLRAGGSFLDVFVVDARNGSNPSRPVLSERWTGTWSATYLFRKWNLEVDYTGNLYGPMRLPLLGPLDPRPEYSPWWSIQNIQISYKPAGRLWSIYGGVKNLLNFTPAANSIARSWDPFDRDVQFDAFGNALSTPDNPYALTFDPSYVYASNQGIRFFLGARCRLW